MLLLVLACAKDGTETHSGTSLTPADLERCAPDHGPFSAEITNRFLPFAVGGVHVIEGLEGGTDWGRSESRVLDATGEIAGVTTRRVEKRSYEGSAAEPILVEIAIESYAQAPDGSVCAYGETTQEIDESGNVVEEDGWEAGDEGARPGLFMPAAPEVGQVYTMVYVPPDDVETAEVTAVGDAIETPAGTFDDTVSILEDGPSLKHYAAGIGMIYDDGMALASY